MHMKICHSSQSDMLICSKSQAQKKQPKTPKVRKCKPPPPQRFFECYICKCQLEDRAAARKHIKLHAAARSIMCKFCRKRFTPNELLEWHICGNDGMELQQIACEYCDQSFRSLVKCMQHLEAVHSDETFCRCRKCSQYFGMMALRDFHEKYFPHQELGSFQCKLCECKYGYKSSLLKHLAHFHSVKGIKFTNLICSLFGFHS